MTGAPSVEAQLAVINTKLDLLIEQRSDHETRLRKMEQFKWGVIGWATALGGAAGTIAGRFN